MVTLNQGAAKEGDVKSGLCLRVVMLKKRDAKPGWRKRVVTHQLFEDGVVDELEDEVQLPLPAKNFDQVDQVLVPQSLKRNWAG